MISRHGQRKEGGVAKSTSTISLGFAIDPHGQEGVLIIVDYLQLWAKAAESLRRGMVTVREPRRSDGQRLRELAARLNSPVLAIANQNRRLGDYGKERERRRWTP